ncbi:hypothetical protein ACFXHA_38855 [Nocardia sp. NPDC059240]|uniref:hypothetical protein n=1 Tax=Nocardia sp. NPDC059240 TaxID=3346786 RepID=UPI0036932FFA
MSMEFEHEEAMRTDFAERIRLTYERNHAEFELGATPDELAGIDAARRRIEQAWEAGPHSRDWRYLGIAFRTWACAPEDARQHLEWARYYRDEVGQDQLDPVQWRSLEQAQELSGNTFEVDYERNGPDTYRHAPGTPILEFGNTRRQIERGR